MRRYPHAITYLDRKTLQYQTLHSASNSHNPITCFQWSPSLNPSFKRMNAGCPWCLWNIKLWMNGGLIDQGYYLRHITPEKTHCRIVPFGTISNLALSSYVSKVTAIMPYGLLCHIHAPSNVQGILRRPSRIANVMIKLICLFGSGFSLKTKEQ